MDIPKADFSAFYAAAMLYQQGQPVYDLSAQCAIQQKNGAILCLPFSHPPLLIPLLSLVVTDNYIASYWRWVAILFSVLGICFIPLCRLTRDWQKCICVLSFYPIYLSLLQGQVSVIILLATLLWTLLLMRGSDYLAGAALSLTCVKPHIALALAVPLLFSKPRAFVSFAAGSLALMLFSWCLVGTEGMKEIIRLMGLLAGGQGWGTNQHMMPNITGILTRIHISAIWAWPFYCVGMLVNAMLWRWRLNLSSIALGIVIAVLTVPHLHVFDTALLVIPGVLLTPITIPLLSLALIALGSPWATTAVLLGLGVYLSMRLPVLARV